MYPTALNLQTALEAAGLFDSTWNLDLERAMSRSVSQFENEVDWTPFLAEAQVSPRRFTLEGEKTLRLQGGLAAKPTSVIIDGVELVEDETYWLEPESALAKGKPITRIGFARAIRSRMRGVSVTGRWGYCTQLPGDVWSAVLANAACSLEGAIAPRYAASLVEAQNASAPVKAKESGPLRIEYQTVGNDKLLDLGKTFASWRVQYAETLADYMYKAP